MNADTENEMKQRKKTQHIHKAQTAIDETAQNMCFHFIDQDNLPHWIKIYVHLKEKKKSKKNAFAVVICYKKTVKHSA